MANKLAILLSLITLSLYGTSVSAQCGTIDQPNNFRIWQLPDQTLLAQWTPPENHNGCNVRYSLTILHNGLVAETVETENTAHVPIWPGYCVRLDAILFARIGNDVTSDFVIANWITGVEAGFASVTDLMITQTQNNEVLVQWLKPIGFESCGSMTFKVNIGDIWAVTDKEEYTTSLKYCESTIISVMPVIDGTEGIQRTEDVTLLVQEEFLSIDSLNLEVNEWVLTASWTILDGFSSCDLRYEVVYLNDDFETVTTVTTSTEISFDIPEVVCRFQRIQVTPIIDNIRGMTVENNIYTGVEEGFALVSGIWETRRPGDDIVITWNRSPDFQFCYLEYRATFFGIEIPFFREILTVNLGRLEYCDATDIYIVPLIDNLRGEQSVISAMRYPEVVNLEITVTGSILNATWTMPAGYERCGLVFYYMELRRDSNLVYSHILSNTNHAFDVDYECTEAEQVTFFVASRIGSYIGLGLSHIHTC